MKASKVRRKAANRTMPGPRPARVYRVVPTFGNGNVTAVARCTRKVGETKHRKRRFGLKRTVDVLCGGPVVYKRSPRNRRVVWCQACRQRKQERRAALRKPWQLPHTGQQERRSRLATFKQRFHRKTVS